MTTSWAVGLRWLKLSSLVGASQLLVQAVSAVTGILLVRFVSKNDYALFTVTGSLLATLSLLADGGIASAITAMSGRASSDRSAMSSAVHACMSMRNRLSWLALSLTLPPFFLLLRSMHLDWAWVVALLIFSGVTLWPATDSKLLPVPLRALGHVHETQLIDIAGGVARLLLTAFVVFVGYGQIMPVFVATIGSIWMQAWLARRALRRQIGTWTDGIERDKREVRGFVRALYANHVFFCVQGQIATWIITITSHTEQVADIGALARLTVIFSILNAIFGYLVIPSLAATQSTDQVRRKLLAALSLSAVSIVMLVIGTWIWPQPFLWILGQPYYHLQHELVIAFAVQGVAFVNAMLWTVLQIRGWIDKAWLNIPLSLFGYGLAAILLQFNTVSGVLMMSGVACLPPLAWVSLRCWTMLARRS